MSAKPIAPGVYAELKATTTSRSMTVPEPVRSCSRNASPLQLYANGTSRISAYSSACCMPAPTEWWLSFASVTGMGTPGLKFRM